MTLRRKLGDPPVIETVKGAGYRVCACPALSIRARLTALYALLFGASTGVLLALSYWLLSRHLHRTLPDAAGERRARRSSALQYVLAFAGTVLLAGRGVGWAVAGRALAPLERITGTARRVSEERLDERIALDRARRRAARAGATRSTRCSTGSTESFDAQRRFVANASHELRSPLTVIRSEAEVALANPERRPRGAARHGRGRGRGEPSAPRRCSTA